MVYVSGEAGTDRAKAVVWDAGGESDAIVSGLKGKAADFFRDVKAQEEEMIIFCWIEWPDKAARESGQAKLFAEMKAHMKNNPNRSTPSGARSPLRCEFVTPDG